MKERKNACEEFQKETGALLDREWNDVEVIRISKELRKRQLMLFTFVKFTGVSWHNNDAERAIRKGVLHRKISGGRRTWTGAEIFEVILSIYETSKIRTQFHNPVIFIISSTRLLRSSRLFTSVC